jgi:hypothetical protein
MAEIPVVAVRALQFALCGRSALHFALLHHNYAGPLDIPALNRRTLRSGLGIDGALCG